MVVISTDYRSLMMYEYEYYWLPWVGRVGDGMEGHVGTEWGTRVFS